MRRVKNIVKKWVCRQSGQATVEYVLLLASVVVILSAFLTAFHKNIVRFLFSFIGKLLTS